ncbi:septal ring factor EnvC (AmiA/AmiB activator) [Neisseria sp. HSC-16F19]|nr:peptidoglycan DD-metalloendopeptidase family protein [Neisseria sp. HSC-16F19]MCP2040421.1 septal ring factor EnvC (AmiA/AmiB activator) [Neisseria sp. HSC-16F19]
MNKTALLLLLACFSGSLYAQQKNTAPGKNDLKSIQQQIDTTQKRLQETTAQQKSLDGDIAQTRKQLAATQAELAQIGKKQQQTQQNLNRLQQELEALDTQVGNARTQVTRLLNAQYRNRQPHAVMMLLQNAEAGEKGRYLHYMRYLNRANEQLVGRLQQQQQELAEQQKAVDAQLKTLAGLRAQQQKLLSGLNQKQQQQVSRSQDLSRQADAHSRRLQQLREDEQRMNRLIRQLSAQSAAKRKAAAQAQSKAAANKTPANKARPKTQTTPPKQAAKAVNTPAPQTNKPQQAAKPQTAPSPTPAPQSTLTAEDMALSAPQETPAAAAAPARFSLLQGQMRRPVGGSIQGRFGQGRPEGGVWKGIFIATAPAAVQSIAPGKVAYASHLQGYGNTVIVDHDDGYVSVYTGLSSLAVGGGQNIAARQTLGTSGQVPGSGNGLYFEIRYRSQPMNPLSWVS